MLALVTIASSLIVASVNGLVVPQQLNGPDHPFNLKIQSEAKDWDGQYVVPLMVGKGFDVAGVSPMPFQAPSFYCDHATQELRCKFADASHAQQPTELVGAFSTTKSLGQTFQPLYFSAKETEGMDTTKGLGFTKDGHLTFNGGPCNWYACKDTVARIPGADKQGLPIFAVNLLIGEKPMDPSCQKVEIIKELQ